VGPEPKLFTFQGRRRRTTTTTTTTRRKHDVGLKAYVTLFLHVH
jgi:hypothetical protein